MKVLGIIPARGGSKGVPKKNSKLLAGKPLISYTIEAANKSKLLTDVYVATDDKEIIKISKQYNCAVYKRNSANAQDDSPVALVVEELIHYLEVTYDLIILLQPTAPIREGKDIDNVIEMFLEDHNLKNVVSVIELEDIHPARMYTISNEKILKSLLEKNEHKRRQELVPVYLRNGSIYAITTNEFLKNKKLILNQKSAYIMPFETWANIDTERDFMIAELLIKERMHKIND